MTSPFYGKFRGVVVDDVDPLGLGRIQALVPDVYGDGTSGWAFPCAPFGGPEAGFFAVPPVGAGVWIEFEHGDPDYPIWSGCWWGSREELPATWTDAPGEQIVIRTALGSSITITDLPEVGGIVLEASGGAKVVIGVEGVALSTPEGAEINLTGPEISISSGASEITVLDDEVTVSTPIAQINGLEAIEG